MEDDWDMLDDVLDHCDECRGLGDDYHMNKKGELVSACDNCGMNPCRIDDDW